MLKIIIKKLLMLVKNVCNLYQIRIILWGKSKLFPTLFPYKCMPAILTCTSDIYIYNHRLKFANVMRIKWSAFNGLNSYFNVH